jgi:glycosylphosphatidylinositol transamidase
MLVSLIFSRGSYSKEINRTLWKDNTIHFLKHILYRYAICIYIIGLIWVCLLPLDMFHQTAHTDEKALLVGQVVRSFNLGDKVSAVDGLDVQFKSLGLDTSSQTFTYKINSNLFNGTNIHGIYRAPRSQGNEALVFSAPLKTKHGLNVQGIQIMLSLAQYFKSISSLT